MVLMRSLNVKIDDDLYEWINERRGDMEIEEFTKMALKEYRNLDAKSTSVKVTRLRDSLSSRLDELESRIMRLNRSLKETPGEAQR